MVFDATSWKGIMVYSLLFLFFALTGCGLLPNHQNGNGFEDMQIFFDDPKLEQVIRGVINKPTAPILLSDVMKIEVLNARGLGIQSLGGMEYLHNLKILYLQEIRHDPNNQEKWKFNEIQDLSPLTHLNQLNSLNFSYNQVTDLTPLRGLTKLVDLWFCSNQVSDLSPLKDMILLKWLDFRKNQVTDIKALEELQSLEWLLFGDNQVEDLEGVGKLIKLEFLLFEGNQVLDITHLKNLTNLRDLYFRKNQVENISILQDLTKVNILDFSHNLVSDISALVDNQGFGPGNYIDMRFNQLDLQPESIPFQMIHQLLERGINVQYQPQQGDDEAMLYGNLYAKKAITGLWEERYKNLLLHKP